MNIDVKRFHLNTDIIKSTGFLQLKRQLEQFLLNIYFEKIQEKTGIYRRRIALKCKLSQYCILKFQEEVIQYITSNKQFYNADLLDSDCKTKLLLL